MVVFSALMAINTTFAIPLPFGGLAHFGNTVMWTAFIMFGGFIGGLAGGIGGMIVDILLTPIWAPFTPFCKLASGIACGLVSGEIKSINTVTIDRIVLAVIAGVRVNLLVYASVYSLLLVPERCLLGLLDSLLLDPVWPRTSLH